MGLRSAIEILQKRAVGLPGLQELWMLATAATPCPTLSGNRRSGSSKCHYHSVIVGMVQKFAPLADGAPSPWKGISDGRANRTSSSLGVVSPAPPKLNDVVVLESIQKLAPEDIATMWNRYCPATKFFSSSGTQILCSLPPVSMPASCHGCITTCVCGWHI